MFPFTGLSLTSWNSLAACELDFLKKKILNQKVLSRITGIGVYLLIRKLPGRKGWPLVSRKPNLILSDVECVM